MKTILSRKMVTCDMLIGHMTTHTLECKQEVPVRLAVPSYDKGCSAARAIRKSAKVKLNVTRSSPAGPKRRHVPVR